MGAVVETGWVELLVGRPVPFISPYSSKPSEFLMALSCTGLISALFKIVGVVWFSLGMGGRVLIWRSHKISYRRT